MYTTTEDQSRRGRSAACVLIVDDTPANIIAMQALVRTLKCDVATAVSGEEAVSLAATREFALVLLDVMMPGLNGFQTLQRLRLLPHARATPVILMTAQVMHRGDLEHAYELGAVDYIAKPIEATTLLGKVRAFLSLFEQAHEIRRQAEALRAKDTHLGVLAHDLRTPLSVVAMTAGQLESHSDPNVQRAAGRLSRAAHRMQTLSDDLLETARMALGEFRFTPERVRLADLVSEQLSDLEAIYPGVQFVADVPSAIECLADRLRLQQAVSNLLTNAIKYGGGQVWVLVRQEGADTTYLEVSNECDPLEPGRIEELFAPFQKGSERGDGVGLGLHIVREIARLHGGSAHGAWRDRRITFTLRLGRAARNAEK